MKAAHLSAGFFLITAAISSAQTAPRRSIDRCAQDGSFFYGVDDSTFGPHDQLIYGKPLLISRNGIQLKIVYARDGAHVTISRKGHDIAVVVGQTEPTLDYLTVSEHGIAWSWSPNAHAWDTKMFAIRADGSLIEDQTPINSAEKIFSDDAKRFCKTPGAETSAIKWIDQNHLLIGIDAWSDGFCDSTFTEGFILDISKGQVEQKLTERQLIDLPGVCTWNLVDP